MSNQNQWEQVSGGSNNPRWEPHKQQFDPNNPPTLVGYFKDFLEMPGRNGTFMVAVIHTVDPQSKQLGQEMDVSCSKVLEDALSKVNIGDFIAIQFGGKVQSKSGGNSYNMWKVFKDPSVIPYEQVGGVIRRQRSSSNTNSNNQQNQQQGNQQPFSQGQQTQNGNGQQNFGGNNQQFGVGQQFGGGQQNLGNQQQNFGGTNNQQGGQQNFQGQGNNQGGTFNAPVFNQGSAQNNAQSNAGPKTNWTPQQNQNTSYGQGNQSQNQNFNNQQGGQQNFQGQGNNQGAGNGNPIFTGNADDNDDLPF